MNDPPKVSVIIPNYNHAQFVEKRIETVLNQTYQDFEIILLDDASTDHSVQILNKFVSNPRIKVVLNEKNSGSAFRQWQKGLELAQGKYLWIAESDDFSDSTLLEKLIAKLEKDPMIQFAYCQSWYVDAEGQKIGTALNWTQCIDENRWKKDFVNDGMLECTGYLSARNTIPNASAVVFRKSAFPPIDDVLNMKLCADWIIWGRIARKGKIAYCAEHLNYFRTHHQTARSSTDWKMRDHEWIKAVKENFLCTDIPDEFKKELGIRLTKSWIKTINPRSTYLFQYVILLKQISCFYAFFFLSLMTVKRIRSMFVSAMQRLKKGLISFQVSQ